MTILHWEAYKGFQSKDEHEYEFKPARVMQNANGVLKWSASAFRNIPKFSPDSGIMHQVNMEYLSSVVFVHQRDDGTKNFIY